MTMPPPIEVGRWNVLCRGCGGLLAFSRYSQEDANENAMGSGFGAPGQWECDDCAEKRRNPRGDYCLTEDWGYDNSVLVAGVELSIQKARKPHPCCRHINCQIKPGQEYIRQTVAPWVMVADDVDDEGRTVGSRNDEWSVSCWHRYADEHNEGEN